MTGWSATRRNTPLPAPSSLRYDAPSGSARSHGLFCVAVPAWLGFSRGSERMHVMFAEDIGGWLVAGALFLASLVSSLLALGALYPACKGRRHLTLCLIAPAIITAVVAVCYFANAYTHREFHDHEEIVLNYVQPWLLMGLPPLATSILSGGVLLWKQRR